MVLRKLALTVPPSMTPRNRNRGVLRNGKGGGELHERRKLYFRRNGKSILPLIRPFLFSFLSCFCRANSFALVQKEIFSLVSKIQNNQQRKTHERCDVLTKAPSEIVYGGGDTNPFSDAENGFLSPPIRPDTPGGLSLSRGSLSGLVQ